MEEILEQVSIQRAREGTKSFAVDTCLETV